MTEKNIKDISEIFGVSKSALRYWEKKGLISLDRNTDNDYRVYSRRSIFELQDMLIYRSFDMPLKYIRQINESSVDYCKNILSESHDNISEQISRLRTSLRYIENKMNLIDEYYYLLENPYKKCEMAKVKILPWKLTNYILELYSNLPHKCYYSLIFKAPYTSFSEGLILPYHFSNGDSSPIWSYDESAETTHIAFLLKSLYADGNQSDIGTHIENIHKQGLSTGTIICKYLTSGTENNVKYDYFKAIVEVF